MKTSVTSSWCTTRGRSLRLDCRAENCLIVNTKGGAHALIGYHLAKKLMTQGHSVTLMNDGKQVSYLRSSAQLIWICRVT